MRVRCRATADYRSNAVGALELECTPAGLSVTLARVSSYREGYAPGPPLEQVTVCVPWSGVYATLLGADELLLSVDASRLSLNRFRLGEFAAAALPEDARTARARRLRWTLAAGVAALALLALLLGQRGALPYPGVMRTLGGSVLLVSLVAAALRAMGRRRLPPDEVLRQLSQELARHLAHHVPSEPPSPPPRPQVVSAVSARLPRSAFAVAVTLAATSLAAIVGGKAALPRRAPPHASAESVAPAAPAAPASAAPAAPGAAGASPGPVPAGTGGAPAVLAGACRCARDESWLWSAPVPRLSPLVLASRQREHDGHPHLELELALVNNGATPLVDLTLTVLFQEQRAGSAEQRQTGERALGFPGPLAPGSAARWRVEGMGTSVDLIGPDLGRLAADGSDAAPPDAAAELAAGAERPLRLHAARLLALLGDPRARRVASSLQQAASAGEAAVIERLLDEPPLLTCELSSERESSGQWRTRACVHNRSREARTLSMARLLAFAEPLDPARPGERVPALLAEQPARLAAVLPPGVGQRLELLGALQLEESRAPRAFELVIEEEVQ